MWDIDINNYCFAGVHRNGLDENMTEALRDWLNGCSVKTFINAGVMLMNLKKIREHGNFFVNAMNWIEQHVHLMAFSDQDVINNLFYGEIKLIDTKFNNSNPKREEQLPNSIIHTPTKSPEERIWSVAGLPSQKLYWKYYLLTAWGENATPSEIVHVLMTEAEKSSPMNLRLYHSNARYCLKQLSVSIPRKIFWRNALIVPIRYVLSDIFHKIKYRLSHRTRERK